MKFKVGDRVCFIGNSQLINKDENGIVVGYEEGRYLPYKVLFGEKVWTVSGSELQLKQSAISTYTLKEIADEIGQRPGDIK